jgi:hypothetical protein
VRQLLEVVVLQHPQAALGLGGGGVQDSLEPAGCAGQRRSCSIAVVTESAQAAGAVRSLT